MKFLLVDDDLTTIKILQNLLSVLGECDFADNGKRALELCAEMGAAGTPYSTIFLDIMMPDRNGHSVLKEIRALEQRLNLSEKARAKVIIISGLGDPTNKLEAFKGDCQAYLVKPISREKIFAELKRLGIAPSE